MAVDDGAALAVVLNKIRSEDELKFAIDVFQASMVNAMIWQFADGPEQRARDEAMRLEVGDRLFQGSPNQ
ncbi:unnamed protein product [Clonostachys rosea]|uniref:TetR family transcriptional regulator n=1 Tax=Bionectria ochroleuca TaxID=29856 RepID=A0ABY6V0X0_BIOOC|nr:unnamed protein product [Clonostachys rosea]